MKTTLLFIIIFPLTSLFMLAHAQFLGGFFSQQSDKQKLMLAQIAGYETELNAVKTGYKITETGLNTAYEMKSDEFNLHTAYFNSLEQVNPAIQSNPKAKACASLLQQIITAFDQEIAWQQQQKILSTPEITYIQNVYTNLLAKCKTDMDELTQVLTPGKVQMTDQQRISKIDAVYASMQDKQAFASSFTSKCRKLAIDRKQAGTDRSTLKSLYGIQ